ncbi:hypothetical protein LCGC14_0682520 [marine sediment metagenome]|uniref:Uncharacterized protein n=1 Tax=marine sediment metagenome TaxID=412755 RepID=A0A0F9TVW5_9ZZZZ
MRTANERSDNSVKKTLPSIHRQKPWIDRDIVNMSYAPGINYTEYGLFHDDRLPDDIHDIDSNTKDIWKNTNHACFAGLLGKLYKQSDKYNRIFYTIYLKEPYSKKRKYYNPGANILLSMEECIRWIQLAEEHKMLPDYIDENLIEMFEFPIKLGNGNYSYNEHNAVGKGTAVLDLTDLTQAQLYLYLSMLRVLREDPGLVRVAIYLTDKCKMNFYAAYVFASRIAISTTEHHTITVFRKYNEVPRLINPKTGRYKKTKTKLSNIEAATTDISWMIGLQRFATNPKKHDKNLAHQCTSSFLCSSIIGKISAIHANINIYEALDPDIIKAIMAAEDTTSRMYVTKFLKSRSIIKYKRASKQKEITSEG